MAKNVPLMYSYRRAYDAFYLVVRYMGIDYYIQQYKTVHVCTKLGTTAFSPLLLYSFLLFNMHVLVEVPRNTERERRDRCWLGGHLLFFRGDFSWCIKPQMRLSLIHI